MCQLSSQSRARNFFCSILLYLLASCLALPTACPPAESQQVSSAADATKRQFLSALDAYRKQNFTKAEGLLRPLAKANPGSFDVNELLGLVYVAEEQDAKASSFLDRAVQLRPRSVEARTMLATCLLRLHREDEAEAQFKKAVALEPRSYDANHNLGEFYIQAGRLPDAIAFLKRAQDADPAAENNGYDLALAYEKTGNLDAARQQLKSLLPAHNSADLHSLLGEIEEKQKNYLASAQQYEKAARMDPSEQNIFDWGTELLLHQTFDPAVEVFKAGLEKFPQSFRLQVGYGIALYGLGHFDEGAKTFMRAADMAPPDPLPLTFLGQAYDNLSPTLADAVQKRLHLFLEKHPTSAPVLYYYAMCLSKLNERTPAADLPVEIESSLKAAVANDPSYADAYLQLGILYANQKKYSDAVAKYQKALQLNPALPDAHYRLGQALVRTGDRARAQQEFSQFEHLRQSQVDKNNRQTAAIQQFVYTMRNSEAPSGQSAPAPGAMEVQR